jgi:hypothetical protein
MYCSDQSRANARDAIAALSKDALIIQALWAFRCEQ